MKTEAVIVNNVTIECPVENGVYYVAIRPICEALGIDYRKQFDRIKADRKLGQLVTHTLPTQIKMVKIMRCFACP